MAKKRSLKKRVRPRRSRIEVILEIFKKNPSNDEKVIRIALEFKRGLDFLEKYCAGKMVVTFFGSAILPLSHPVCREAYHLARWAAHSGYVVITGGSGSVMQAANKGARDSNGISIGVLIRLPKLSRREQKNRYLDASISCKYFFARKFLLAIGDLYFVFAGGFGTMDELYEIATLIQTKKILPIPIILVDDRANNGFWAQHLAHLKKLMLNDYKTIRAGDLAIFHHVIQATGAIAHAKRLARQGRIELPSGHAA